jgi:glycosyltransferase involved in cell wall biosynthesis
MLRRPLTPPRRLLLTTDAVGGVWRYAVEVSAGLAAQGVEVLLVGSGPRPSAAQTAEIAALPGVALEWLDLPLDWLAPDGHELRAFPTLLASLVARHGIDLVHLSAPSQAVGLAVACPIVATTHSCLATWSSAMRRTPPEDWLWRIDLNRAGFARADLVLAPSAAFADALIAAYGPLPHLGIVRNGRPPRGPAPPGKGDFVLAAGRWWDPAKNLSAIDAAAALCRWPVRIAGGLAGPQGAPAAPRHAEALGNLGPAAMVALQDAAPIFLSPAFYEPFGLAVLEAAQAGAALILSDIPTFRELWGGTAVFVDPDDPHAIAAALNDLVDAPARRAELARAARRRASAYGLDAQIDGLLQAYARASGAHGPQTARAWA